MLDKLNLDLINGKYTRDGHLPVRAELYCVRDFFGFIILGDWCMTYYVDGAKGKTLDAENYKGLKINIAEGAVLWEYSSIERLLLFYLVFKPMQSDLSVIKFDICAEYCVGLQDYTDKTSVILDMKTGLLTGEGGCIQLKPWSEIQRGILMGADFKPHVGVGITSQLHSFYGNFFYYNGILYSSIESAFQSMKTENRSKRLEIAELSPQAAIARGRHIRPSEYWKTHKKDILMEIVHEDYSSSKELMRKLYNLDEAVPIINMTGYCEIDIGVCYCKKCRGAGQNLLGKALKEYRIRQFGR